MNFKRRENETTTYLFFQKGKDFLVNAEGTIMFVTTSNSFNVEMVNSGEMSEVLEPSDKLSSIYMEDPQVEIEGIYQVDNVEIKGLVFNYDMPEATFVTIQVKEV